MSRNSLSFVLAAVVALAAAAPEASAQRSREEVCTVCLNDPETMEAAQAWHRDFPFGKSTAKEIEEEYFWHPVWIETPHFRVGAALEEWKVPESERKAYRAELTELEKKFPEINPRRPRLDRWLRAHLLAERCEEAYREFQELVGRDEAYFQDAERNRMLGIGPYLGMHDKYEVMIFELRGPYREFMSTAWGRTSSKPQRWNNVQRKCLWFGMTTEEDSVRHDQHLHNFVRHNLAINMLNGYEFYSYDLPVWIKEGLAHWFRLRNDTRFHMYDSVEGAFQAPRNVDDWAPEVRKLVKGDEAASFAELLRRMSFAELSFDDHLVIWSKIDFLVQQGPDKFAGFITDLKSRRNEDGSPDSSNLDGAQREAMLENFGWSLPRAEEEWREWVLQNYPSK